MAALMASTRTACSGRYSDVTFPELPALPVLPTCRARPQRLAQLRTSLVGSRVHSFPWPGMHHVNMCLPSVLLSSQSPLSAMLHGLVIGCMFSEVELQQRP